MTRETQKRDARTAELQQRIERQRRELTEEADTLTAGVARLDGWITVAKRLTPALAVGVTAAAVVAGPARVGRWLRTAVVPVLVIRQFLSGRR
jgi:hypothetical protein